MPTTILALIDFYLPGYKGGGPLRTLEAMVERLGGDLRFRVLTRDRDSGDVRPYPDIEPSRWYPKGAGEVAYLAPAQLGLTGIRRIICRTEHDVLYLNSLFSLRLTFFPLLLRRLRLLPRRPVVLAPRGELHPGAMGVGTWHGLLPRAVAARIGTPKWLKKRLYISLCRRTGLFDGLVFQAASSDEREHIVRHLGPDARVYEAPDLTTLPPDSPPRPAPKHRGKARVAFLSRVNRKKNLDGAIALLDGVTGEVEFNIYGPIEDRAYWADCRARLSRLPPNVRARYHGAISHDLVSSILGGHDLLLFPTLGESFGHVILEALVAGVPVVISDRTPWRELRTASAGWDLPLDDPDAFRAVLQMVVDMDEQGYASWSRGARAFGRKRSSDVEIVRSNERLFALALAGEAASAPLALRMAAPQPPRLRERDAVPVTER